MLGYVKSAEVYENIYYHMEIILRLRGVTVYIYPPLYTQTGKNFPTQASYLMQEHLKLH